MKKYTHIDQLLKFNQTGSIKSSARSNNGLRNEKLLKEETGQTSYVASHEHQEDLMRKLRIETVSPRTKNEEVPESHRVKMSQRTLNETCRSPQSINTPIHSKNIYKTEVDFLPQIEDQIIKLKDIHSVLS